MDKKAQTLTLSIGIFSLSLVVAGVLLHSPTREKIQDLISPKERRILSLLTATVIPGRDEMTIAKVRVGNSLFIEAFERNDKEQTTELKAKHLLSESRDAYFELQGNASNLALFDIDGDHIAEILTATLDADLVPHFYVFKWNPSSESFDPLDSKYWPSGVMPE